AITSCTTRYRSSLRKFSVDVRVGGREPAKGAGARPLEPDWTLPPTVFGLLAGCAQVVSPKVLAPFRPRAAFLPVLHVWTRLGTEDFLGAREPCQGRGGAGPAPPRLDPDGWLVRIPAPKELRLRARKPRKELIVHLPTAPRKRNTPGR